MGLTMESKKVGGRPTSYKPEYAEQAAKLCALGATDNDLADFFGVSKATINTWKGKHPKFLVSLKETKALLDATIERSLHQRAQGFEHTGKYYPPDPTSMIFWLKNRQPERWRDRVDHAVTGKITLTRVERIVIDDLVSIQPATSCR